VDYGFFPPAHPSPTVEGTLLDDGTSEDVRAGDGIFTAALSSDLVEVAADYFVRLQAEDQAGNKSNPAVAIIRGRPRLDSAPVIGEIEAPAIVNANAIPEVVIRAQATDPDGLADIDTVTLRIFLPDGQEDQGSPRLMLDDGNPANSGDLVEGDGTFSNILPVANVGAEPIDLRLVFRAKDVSGFLSPAIEHLLKVVRAGILDDAPVISKLYAPNEVQVDPARDRLIFMAVDVQDPQGQADIETVWFRSFLPSGQEAQNSPTLLFDDGMMDVSGDELAGDGTFSVIIRLPPGTPPGNFRFVFEAFDQSGLSSSQIEHIVNISN
jgi:hypothetical protein